MLPLNNNKFSRQKCVFIFNSYDLSRLFFSKIINKIKKHDDKYLISAVFCNKSQN